MHLPIDINIHAPLSIREDGSNQKKEYSLEIIQKYNMNNIGDSSTGGFNNKNILTMEDFQGRDPRLSQETYFRLYSYILSLIHQKHIQKKLFKYLVKHVQLTNIYADDETKIGINTSNSLKVNELFNSYLLSSTKSGNNLVSEISNYLSSNQIKEIKKQICAPVYMSINVLFKTTTIKKIMYQYDKKQGLDILLDKYSDLFYNYCGSDLKSKSEQLRMFFELFCIYTEKQKGNGIRFTSYKNTTRKGAKNFKKFL
jgi:hypothetical protein